MESIFEFLNQPIVITLVSLIIGSYAISLITERRASRNKLRDQAVDFITEAGNITYHAPHKNGHGDMFWALALAISECPDYSNEKSLYSNLNSKEDEEDIDPMEDLIWRQRQMENRRKDNHNRSKMRGY